jgi:hypothetical protein
MKLSRFRAALCLLGLSTALHAAAIDPALQTAPADGFGAGTVGGSAALSSQIYTVATRPQRWPQSSAAASIPRSSS